MSLRTFTDKLIQQDCLTIINQFVPLFQQNTASNSNTVKATIYAVGSDGKLTVQTSTGQTITGVLTANSSIGPGQTGTLLAGVLFIS